MISLFSKITRSPKNSLHSGRVTRSATLKIILIAALSIITFPSCGLRLAQEPLSGEIRKSSKSDTLKINYKLVIHDMATDSVRLSIPYGPKQDKIDADSAFSIDSLLYVFDSPISPSSRSYSHDSVRNELVLSGSVSLAEQNKSTINKYQIAVFSREPDDSKTQTEYYPYENSYFLFHPIGNAERDIEAGWAYFDKFGYPFPARSDNKRMLFVLSDKLGYSRNDWTAFLSYRINYSKYFYYNEYGVLGVDFYPGGRDGYLPLLGFAGKFTQIKASGGDAHVIKRGFVAEAGIRMHLKYDSFGYSYTHLDGGIHRFDLSIAWLAAVPRQAFGTRYSYHCGDHFKMFQVLIYADFQMLSDEPMYLPNRPTWQRLLAMGPWLPYVLLFALASE